MISKILNQLWRSSAATARRPDRRGAVAPLALACFGVLLGGVLAPKTALGQGGLVIPGGGGYAIPPQNMPQGVPISPYYQPNPFGQQYDRQQGVDDGYGRSLPPQVNRTCLQARTLSGVVASDDREVILRFGRDGLYRVRLTKACPALLMPGANVAGVTRSTGGMICNPYDVELKVVAGDGSTSRCTGATLSRMTAAQVKAASAPTSP